MSYPRFQASRAFKFFTRTAGDLTLNSNGVWADLPTIGTTWDISLAGQVGDVIEASLSCFVGSAVVGVSLDVFTIVSAAAVNAFSNGVAANNANAGGVQAWYAAFSSNISNGGSVFYALQAGDISSGTVTVRLRYQTDVATNRTVKATTAFPLQFSARNLGPVDPH